MVTYEVTFKHRISGDKKTYTLGDSRTIANEEWKKIRKRLSWWWKSGIICVKVGYLLDS